QSLVGCIRAYGLRHFKVKVSGDLTYDLDRLRRVAAILQEAAPPEFAFTLDANERFQTLPEFRNFWEGLLCDRELRRFFEHPLFVEQPLPRKVDLSGEVGDGMRQWPARPPLIIDESDSLLYNFEVAVELGYAGSSHKNCKGVFKSILNACLREHF